jgi:hypothetical protein
LQVSEHEEPTEITITETLVEETTSQPVEEELKESPADELVSLPTEEMKETLTEEPQPVEEVKKQVSSSEIVFDFSEFDYAKFPDLVKELTLKLQLALLQKDIAKTREQVFIIQATKSPIDLTEALEFLKTAPVTPSVQTPTINP